MRSLPFDTTVALGLPYLITITRGDTIIRFTTYENPIIVNGVTWPAGPGAMVSNLQFSSDGSPSTASVNIWTENNGIINPGEDARGLFDGWPISLAIVDPDDTGVGAFDMMPGATIGNIVTDSHGLFTISVVGALNKTRREVTEHYALTGREDLGDDRCKIPICPADIARGVAFVRADVATGLLHVNDAYGRVRSGSPDDISAYGNVYFECTTPGTTDATTAPSYDFTIGNTTVDGTATLTARNSWLRYAYGQAIDPFVIQLTDLPDSRASDDTWFVNGGLYIRSGNLKSFPKIPIRAWDHALLQVTTFLPVAPSDVPANTQMEIHAGCDLTREMCYARFNNIINLRAETFVPPSNLLLSPL